VSHHRHGQNDFSDTLYLDLVNRGPLGGADIVDWLEDVGRDRRAFQKPRHQVEKVRPRTGWLPASISQHHFFSISWGAVAMQLAKYVKFREERFGGVLFETQTEKVYTLNPTAAAVIRELGAGCDITQLTERLADRFHAPVGSIEQDVATLIDDLRQKGLVEDAKS
jgi:hypothetical protein